MGSRLILNYHDRQSSRNLLMEMGLWLKKVLIMGASGLVGRAIIEEFKEFLTCWDKCKTCIDDFSIQVLSHTTLFSLCDGYNCSWACSFIPLLAKQKY
jgi:hypothetical protein